MVERLMVVDSNFWEIKNKKQINEPLRLRRWNTN